MVTLNVAVHSSNNALMTLLISNQFVELKGSVFKKFEKENVFQITCSGIIQRKIASNVSDIVERFQMMLFLFIITLQNISDSVLNVTVDWLVSWIAVVGTL